jgi:5-methylcytosine-specific restriction protein A
MLKLVTNETKIINYQELLDKTLKAALASEKEVRLGTRKGVNLNYNQDIWFGTWEKEIWYWNSFGLSEELDVNGTNILLEINIKTSNLDKRGGGGFLIDDENDNILLFHRGNLNHLKINFLEWYGNKQNNLLKEIDNGERVIVIGVIKSNNFVRELTNYIKDVSSFKELVRKENSHEHVNDDNEIEIESLSDSTINSLLQDIKKTDFEKIERIIFVHKRDRAVVEEAKRLANGECQLCGCDAPFNNENFEPYLEVHHIKWLSQGGNDCIENTVALCPNCHRKMHILNLEEDVAKLTEVADPSW